MKYLTLLLLSAATPVFAGSSGIYLNDDYQHVFATPSGNILCGGNSHKHAKADKRYTNDLYCFIGLNKAMPKRCEKQAATAINTPRPTNAIPTTCIVSSA